MPADRDETHDEIVRRLQINWDRNRGRYVEVLIRLINSLASGENVSFSGIERDLIVYALAAINSPVSDPT